MITGFTSGAFNLIHPGHVWFLNECKHRCSKLIVAVARDEITKQKRPPVMNEEQRLYMIQNLRCVDEAIFEKEMMPPENIKNLLIEINPDIFFTNSDNPNLETYKKLCEELVIEMEVMERYKHGGRVFNVSTTRTIAKIKKDKVWE